MSVVIRLARGGRKKLPYYAIVVANSRAPRDGRFIEKVGSYNPMLPQGEGNRVVLNEDRVKHWLSVGAQPTDRVALFLSRAGLIKDAKKAEQTKQHLPRAKAQMRLKEQEAEAEAKRQAEEDAKAAAEAEAAAAAEATAAPAEAPAEEAPAAETVEAEAPAEDNKEETAA